MGTKRYGIAKELVKGAIDIHVHSEPSFFKRSVNDITLAEELLAYGMGGALIKCHEGSSVCRAKLAEIHVGGQVSIFGSLVLNAFVGGLNPYAVDAAIKLGAKTIFMPTTSAENHISYYGGTSYKAQKSKNELLRLDRGIKITDEHGCLQKTVIEIMDLLASNDVCLATGHLSNTEGLLLCHEALKRGVKKLVFTHADFETNRLPLTYQIELANKGVFIEKTLLSLDPRWNGITSEEMAISIKAVGANRCIMSTDYGQLDNPTPCAGMTMFIDKMLENNIPLEDIRTMIDTNPHIILS